MTLKLKTEPFKSLIFDVGDILYDATYWRKWLSETLRQRGTAISYEGLVQEWERFLVPVYSGKVDYWTQFEKLLSGFGLSVDQRTVLIAESKEQAKIAKSSRKAFPQVQETLSELYSKGVVLIALSDSESDKYGIMDTLDQLKIKKYFSEVLSSRDIGMPKPNPEAYDAAVNASGVPKEFCAFVGHDIDELDGAHDFGLATIAFNYAGNAKADVYINEFRQLIDLVSNTFRA